MVLPEEVRLQRMEDKIDKVMEAIIETRIVQQELLHVNRRQDDQEESGKTRDREVVDLTRRVHKLEDRQRTIIKVGSLVLLALLTAYTGINFL